MNLSLIYQLKQHISLLSIMAFCLIMPWISGQLYAADDVPIIKITTALGVETQVAIYSVSVENDILSKALDVGLYNSCKLPLEVAKGIYVSVPLDMVRSVLIKDKKHIIQLVNNEELKGKLLGTIKDKDGKLYELGTAISLDVISIPKLESSSEKLEQKLAWELKIPGIDAKFYSVIAPVFTFQYYSSSGYIMGGSDREVSDQSFYLKVGDQEHVANIEDFAQLTLTKNVKTKNEQLIVESKTGVITSGTLVLYGKDDQGNHEGSNNWMLSAYMASNNRIHLAISKREWSLSQKSEQK